jgi:hypothetical protein
VTKVLQEGLKGHDLLRLASSGLHDAGDCLEAFYNWNISALQVGARAAFVAALTGLGAFAIALLKGEFAQTMLPPWIALAGPVAILVLGICLVVRVRTLALEFVRAATLLGRMQRSLPSSTKKKGGA